MGKLFYFCVAKQLKKMDQIKIGKAIVLKDMFGNILSLDYIIDINNGTLSTRNGKYLVVDNGVIRDKITTKADAFYRYEFFT